MWFFGGGGREGENKRKCKLRSLQVIGKPIVSVKIIVEKCFFYFLFLLLCLVESQYFRFQTIKKQTAFSTCETAGACVACTIWTIKTFVLQIWIRKLSTQNFTDRVALATSFHRCAVEHFVSLWLSKAEQSGCSLLVSETDDSANYLCTRCAVALICKALRASALFAPLWCYL